MNPLITVARTSLYCATEDYDFYKQITEGNDPYKQPFETMIDAYIAFACIGFSRNAYEPLAKGSDRRELTLTSYMADDKRILVLAALAYVRLKAERPDEDEAELAREVMHTREIVSAVEGWANAGAKIVRAQFQSAELIDNRTLGLSEALLGELPHETD